MINILALRKPNCMLQASELRIGNYVNVPRKDQSPFRIDGFEYLSKDHCKVEMNKGSYKVDDVIGVVPFHPLTWYLKDLEPIHLTPEILEKCNIERTGNLANSAMRKFYRKGNVIFEACAGDRVAVYFDSNAESPLICFLDYLHQLQNLWFALSNQELQVNLS